MKKLIIFTSLLLTCYGCTNIIHDNLGADHQIEYVTAPENNAFYFGRKNYESEYKNNITDENSLTYKLDDKYFSLTPVGIGLDGKTAILPRTAVKSLSDFDSNKQYGGQKYNGVFGQGIDIEIKETTKDWQKILKINSLPALGLVPNTVKEAQIIFEMQTNMVIDGWNKYDDFEINGKVRLGDYSYIEQAKAWDSSSSTNQIILKTVLSEDKGKLYFTKTIPMEWLKTATYPIYTDGHIIYGTAAEYNSNQPQNINIAGIDTDKFVVCDNELITTYDSECWIGIVNDTTITYGDKKIIEDDSLTQGYYVDNIDVCKLDTNKFFISYIDDDDDDKAQMVVGTATSGGTFITLGSPTQITASGRTEAVTCTEYGTDTVILTFNDYGNGDDLQNMICSVSGTTISCGTAIEVDTNEIVYPMRANALDVANGRYASNFSSPGVSSKIIEAVIATTTGNTINGFAANNVLSGQETMVTAGHIIYQVESAYMDIDKYVVAYTQYETTMREGKVIAISSPGYNATPASTSTVYGPIITRGTLNVAIASMNATDYVLVHSNDFNSDGYAIYSQVDWDTMTISSTTQDFFSGDVGLSGANFMPLNVAKIDTDKVVICYSNEADSNDGYCIVGKTYQYDSSTLVSTNNDFGFCYSAGTTLCYNTADSNVRLGYRDGVDYGDCYAAVRFNNVTIPQGATIDEAYFAYTAHDTDATTDNVTLFAEDVDDSATIVFTFANANSPYNKVPTDASVNWTLPNQISLIKYISPDISSVIQEVTDREGWSSGNDLTILIRNNGATENHNARNWSSGVTFLDINYTVSAGEPAYCGHTGGDWYVSDPCTIDSNTTTNGYIYFVDDGILSCNNNAIIQAKGFDGESGAGFDMKDGCGYDFWEFQ